MFPRSGADPRFGPPGANRSTKKHKVYESNGRGQPCAPQGNVVGTVRMTRPVEVMESRRHDYEIASNNDKPVLAPLGDERDFVIVRGDVVYMNKKQFGQVPRQAIDRDAGVEVFSCVNGLPANTDIVPVGVCDFSPHGSSKDDVGTVARAGTRTVLNTGPDNILEGQIVYASTFPYTVTENGNKRPGIKEIGQAAGKYRPALYGLYDTTVYAFCRRLEIDIENRLGGIDGAVQNAWVFNARDDLDHFVKTELLPALPADHPAFVYAKLYVTIVKIVRMQTGQPGTTVDDLKVLLKYVQDIYKKSFQTKFNDYAKAINGAQSNNSHPIFLNDAADPSLKLTWIFMPTLLHYTHEALNVVRSEIYAYLRGKALGKCTKGGQPGYPIDIDLGYFHA